VWRPPDVGAWRGVSEAAPSRSLQGRAGRTGRAVSSRFGPAASGESGWLDGSWSAEEPQSKGQYAISWPSRTQAGDDKNSRPYRMERSRRGTDVGRPQLDDRRGSTRAGKKRLQAVRQLEAKIVKIRRDRVRDRQRRAPDGNSMDWDDGGRYIDLANDTARLCVASSFRALRSNKLLSKRADAWSGC